MNRYRVFAWMVVLACLAGLVNAVAVFGYDGMTVSHVTGLVSRFAISVGTGDFLGCLDFLSVIFSFFVGAVLAGVLTGRRAFHMEKIYGFVILAIGGLMLLPLVLDARHGVLLFAFLMGLQNGLVVSFRGVLIRSTHMSGNLTDLGVFIGYKIRKDETEPAAAGLVPLAMLLGFCVGGVVGILIYSALGNAVFAVAAGIYFALGILYFPMQKSCTDRNFNDIPDEEE